MNKLNPHSNLASFYRYFYAREDLPNNLCDYFWTLMVAFLLFPFVWIAMVINYCNDTIKLKSRKIIDRNYDLNGKMISGEERTVYYYDKDYKMLSTGFGIVFNVLVLFIGISSLSLMVHLGFIWDNTIYFKNSICGIIFIYLVGIMTTALGILSFIICYKVYGVIYRFIRNFINKRKPELSYKERQRLEDLKWEKKWEKERLARNNPSIFKLAWLRLVAFKEKNCPMITWDYSENKK